MNEGEDEDGRLFLAGEDGRCPHLSYFVWIVERAQSGNFDVSRRHAFVTMVQHSPPHTGNEVSWTGPPTTLGCLLVTGVPPLNALIVRSLWEQ